MLMVKKYGILFSFFLDKILLLIKWYVNSNLSKKLFLFYILSYLLTNNFVKIKTLKKLLEFDILLIRVDPLNPLNPCSIVHNYL